MNISLGSLSDFKMGTALSPVRALNPLFRHVDVKAWIITPTAHEALILLREFGSGTNI